MKKISKSLLFFALILVRMGSMSALAQPDRTQDFLIEAQQIMDRYAAVGASVVVVKNNEIKFQTHLGWKDLDQKTRLGDGDIFRIASISKSFSAISILRLQEQGKLSLEDEASKYLPFTLRNPKFPDIPITIGMLLTHTSSVNDSQQYSKLDFINPEVNPNAHKCYSDYAPGTTYNYCNLNFNMLGAIIEQVSGERFDEYVRHHILEPLGLYGGYHVDSLDHQRFVPLYAYQADQDTYQKSESAYAAPTADWMNHYRMGYDAARFSPTGGMKISARDLARYMIMHLNNGYSPEKQVRIFSPSSAQLMHSKLVHVDDQAGYGLAIRITDSLIPGMRMTGHTGSAYGLFSSMFFNKAEDFGFVVITNGCKRENLDGHHAFLTEMNRCLYKHFIQHQSN